MEELEKLFEGDPWKTVDTLNYRLTFPRNHILSFKKILFENGIYLQTFVDYVIEAGLRGDQRVLDLIEEAKKRKFKEIAATDNLKQTLMKHEKLTKEKTTSELLYEIINQRREKNNSNMISMPTGEPSDVS